MTSNRRTVDLGEAATAPARLRRLMALGSVLASVGVTVMANLPALLPAATGAHFVIA